MTKSHDSVFASGKTQLTFFPEHRSLPTSHLACLHCCIPLPSSLQAGSMLHAAIASFVACPLATLVGCLLQLLIVQTCVRRVISTHGCMQGPTAVPCTEPDLQQSSKVRLDSKNTDQSSSSRGPDDWLHEGS